MERDGSNSSSNSTDGDVEAQEGGRDRIESNSGVASSLGDTSTKTLAEVRVEEKGS
jgi:hypothetical protein